MLMGTEMYTDSTQTRKHKNTKIHNTQIYNTYKHIHLLVDKIDITLGMLH